MMLSETLPVACGDHVHTAARAVYAVAHLASSLAGEPTDATLVEDAAHCVGLAGVAVDLALVSASAQERLDFVLQRMEGATSFEVWFGRRLHVTGESRG